MLALVATLLLTTSIFAAGYSAPYTITESNSNAYTMLPMSVLADNQYLADNGFMKASALDTRVETLGGSAGPHMVVDDRTLTAVAVPADSQTNLYFTTGNTDLTAMDIITGYDGYITRADVAGMELGNNFEVIVDGYIDTSVGLNKVLVYKSGAFWLYISGATDITAAILSANTWTSPTGFVDPDTAWTVETNAYDDNTATYAQSAAIAPSSWSSFLELTHAALDVSGLRYYASDSGGVDITQIDIDLYYDGAWNDIYQGAFTQSAWQTITTIPIQDITASRARFYNNGVGAVNARYHEFDFDEINTNVSVTANAVTSGEHEVKVTADTVDLKIFIDTIQEDTVALAGASVPDNANDYTIADNSTNVTVPYLNLYKHTVGGALVTRYEPNTMIIGTTLPDREVAGNDAVITFGTNPAGVTVTLGGMVSTDQPVFGAVAAEPPLDILPAVSSSDWFTEPDVTGTLLTNPLRPFVTLMSDTTTITEMQAWRVLALAMILLVTTSSIVAVRGHLLVAGIAAGAAIGLAVAWTIFPLWALVFVIGAILGGLVAERSPSL